MEVGLSMRSDFYRQAALCEPDTQLVANCIVENTQASCTLDLLLHPTRGSAYVSRHRSIAYHILHLTFNHSQRSIARCFGRDSTTVSRMISRIDAEIKTNKLWTDRHAAILHTCLVRKAQVVEAS